MGKTINITQSQRAAADPTQSVWVTANAGTGKTKVLTDRVLRLLLTGIEPEKILCLTYTKAAAAEMLGRLQKELAKWVKLSDTELNDTLHMLVGDKPDDIIQQRARQLFLQVLESPEGVRILTIHSLCQSLLKRFALEAGVSPYFRLIEESQASLLLSEARRLLFSEPRLPKDIEGLTPSLQRIAARIGEDYLDKLLNEIIKKRDVFEQWFKTDIGAQAIRERISSLLISKNAYDYYADLSARLSDLDAASGILHTGTTATDQPKAEVYDEWVRHWRNKPETPPSSELLDKWRKCFLTKTYTKSAAPITKKLGAANPHILKIILAEQERVYEFYQQKFAQEAADWSLAVITLAEALLAIYTKLKRDKGFLDYDDLIHSAHNLLERKGIAPWILFKLDSGIDHLLVDEAQDTSPIQWQIIKLLADEFFTGSSARKDKRTLFVVGDEKQSIYRFQGADPQEFARMKQHFAQKISSSGEAWQPVSLSLSFRSTPAVLKLVDSIFSQAGAQDGVIEQESGILHQPNRTDAGRVELWPIFKSDDKGNQRQPWQIPDSRNAQSSSEISSIFAKHIATTIAGWLKEKRYLPAKDRAVEAGDILILVRSRTSFFYSLIRALKKAGVEVAGEDRLKLSEQIAVQDILALADFLLLPQDDLSLACVLKSPLFGISENELFELTYKREGSLWQQVQKHKPDISASLGDWLNKVDYLRPYELLAHILDAEGGRKKLVERLGEVVHDPLNELLSMASDYERLHPPSLQGFVQEFRREEITIKREMEQAGNALRVMTVHGSKGLQAPIVILPDTTSKPSAKDTLLWTDESVLFTPDNAAKCETVIDLKEQRKQAEMREYRRLLYVAVTRAADEIYIGGYLSGNSKNPTDDCWYSHISTAMQEVGKEQTDGSWILADPTPTNPQPSTHNPQPSTHNPQPLPNWFNQPMPDEPLPPRPLTPSRMKQAKPAQNSPLAGNAKRGTLIHRLLEVLPDIPKAQRIASAEILLKKHKIAKSERKEWIAEAVKILDDMRFAAVFGENSLAEVPINAVLKDAQVISGQIDRLVVLEDSVLIIDYKTSKNVPNSEAEIPDYFRAQMQAYIDAIAPIYPDKRTHAAILWTNKPSLMPLALSPSST